jgi:hypothetical protein
MFQAAVGKVGSNILIRLAGYYILLAAAGILLWSILPPSAHVIAADTLAELTSHEVLPAELDTSKHGIDLTALASRSAVGTAGVAIISAFLLALPVAWVYMFTRRKKGYQQSMVLSLILLPVVVAGVVVLVKNSLALAFSLAGIVAAVRFRNTLDDSKDAVYIFLVTGLGLASAVHIDVAVVMSLLFNTIVLGLWYTDFARMPPGLDEERAQRQLQRALAMANRTSEFVARVDREIVQGMAPAQLDALLGRVRRQREEVAADALPKKRPDSCLRIVTTNIAAARQLVEPILEEHCKQWEFLGERPGRRDDGNAIVIEYGLRYRKDISGRVVLDAVRGIGPPFVLQSELPGS